jgi:hypothetical protein
MKSQNMSPLHSWLFNGINFRVEGKKKVFFGLFEITKWDGFATEEQCMEFIKRHDLHGWKIYTR